MSKPIMISHIVSQIDAAVEHLQAANYNAAADNLAHARKHLVSGEFARIDDLDGAADLAAFFGVGVSTVSGWYSNRHRTSMPEPVTYVSTKIPVWSRDAVIDWWTAWVPQKGNKAGTLPWERESVSA